MIVPMSALDALAVSLAIAGVAFLPIFSILAAALSAGSLAAFVTAANMIAADIHIAERMRLIRDLLDVDPVNDVSDERNWEAVLRSTRWSDDKCECALI